MLKVSPKKQKVVKWLMLVVIIALAPSFYLLNIAINHQLNYMIIGLIAPFAELNSTFHSPGDQYNCAVVSSSFQAESYWLYTAKQYDIFPKMIMCAASESYHGPEGPLKHKLAMQWSSDDKKAALIYLGWFVDYYDFQLQQRNPIDVNFYLNVDVNDLKSYHNSISACFEQESKTQVLIENRTTQFIAPAGAGR